MAVSVLRCPGWDSGTGKGHSIKAYIYILKLIYILYTICIVYNMCDILYISFNMYVLMYIKTTMYSYITYINKIWSIVSDNVSTSLH